MTWPMNQCEACGNVLPLPPDGFPEHMRPTKDPSVAAGRSDGAALERCPGTGSMPAAAATEGRRTRIDDLV